MKKYMLILVLALVAMLLVTMPLAMAEAVDAVPEAPGEVAPTDLDPTQLLSPAVFATMTGMILVAGLLTQGVKMVFMRNAGIETIRTMAFIVSVIVVIIAKLVLKSPFEIADIVLIPGNSFIVWFAAMKAYEKTIGASATPAGNAQTTNIH